jgi:hypothetical protein
MGKEVSEAEQQKTSWDSNAITPGTPFMDLLASSLRYWVVQKMNTDPGWKNVWNSLLLFYKVSSGYRFKFSYQTLQYPEKENIKLWISSDDSEAILVMIPIRAMSYMAW